jgi:hypothetical protein
MKNVVINQFTNVSKAKTWYIKEVTKNNFASRCELSGNLMFIYSNRGNLKLNPEYFSLVPESNYQVLYPFILKRFPEMAIRFSHCKPKIMLMNSSDIAKRNYSKF